MFLKITQGVISRRKVMMSIHDIINEDLHKSLCRDCIHVEECIFARDGVVDKCKDYKKGESNGKGK